MRRFQETLALLHTVVHPAMRIIDVGSYGSLVPAFKDIFSVQEITITQPSDDGTFHSEHSELPSAENGYKYPVRIDRCDIESAFPYADEAFDLVLFTEVLEHLTFDPVHTLSEINRITKPGGWFLLSTPNCASAKSFLKILRGGNPYFFPAYSKRPSRDRHNREYAPWEVKELLNLCGYRLNHFRTIDVYVETHPISLCLANWALRISHVCSFGMVNGRNRGDTIFALGEKIAPPTERYPSFLYIE